MLIIVLASLSICFIQISLLKGLGGGVNHPLRLVGMMTFLSVKIIHTLFYGIFDQIKVNLDHVWTQNDWISKYLESATLLSAVHIPKDLRITLPLKDKPQIA